MYLTPEQWSKTALGMFWTNRAKGLNWPIDAVANALMSASSEANDICRRFLGAPGVTVVGPALSGLAANQLSVSSTMGFDVGDEHGIYLPDGALYNIQDVDIRDMKPPYPGVLTLGTNLLGSYAPGAVVTGVIKERTNVTGVSTNFSDQSNVLTQEAQSAEGHSPRDLLNTLVRISFVSSPPILSILSVGTVLRWGNFVNPLPLANIATNTEQGWFRMPIGIFIPPGSDIEVIYIGGYRRLPPSLLHGVGYLAADELANGLSPVATGMSSAGTGVSRAAMTIKARKGRDIVDEVSTLRGMALQRLEPHIRMTP